jgi:uncharacterized protein
VVYQHRGRVDAPVWEVFDWHTRAGAISRLSPPWQPVRVLCEAGSLRDGRAVLRLPGGLRWVATHQPDGFRPPYQFVDQLTSMPLSAVLSWRHTHRFTPTDDGATTVTDTVRTRLPAALLASTFRYRHAQLAADLAAHRWARDIQPVPLTVAMTGSSGLIGAELTALLSTGGHRVIRLVRRSPSGPDERRWDPAAPAPGLFSGVDAVVHLAGTSIAGRFTAGHKTAIRDSRVGPTARLAERAATDTGTGPKVFVCASAVGVYGAERGDDILDEDSAPGDGFLAEVVADWEAATRPAAEAGLRTVTVRTGIVQSPRGGALRPLLPLFAAGLGGPLGDAHRWLPWIAIDDLCDVYLRALVDPALAGPVNAVAPHPARNIDYTRTLARVLRRPALLPTPSIGPRLLLGDEGAAELALASQRVTPARLAALRHPFRHPRLEPALAHLLGRAQP